MAKSMHSYLKYLMIWRFSWRRNTALILALAAIISAFTTYIVMTRSDTLFGPDPQMILGLALVNILLLLALVVVVAKRAFRLWLALKSGSVGSRLQTRIVVMISLVTMIPTLTVAVFSALFLNASIEAWFSQRVNTGLEESVAVAEAYLAEHKAIIQNDVRAIANEIDQTTYEGITSPSAFARIISNQAALRSLTEAAIIQRGQFLAQTELTFSLAFDRLPEQTEALVRAGQIVVIADDDKIRAVIQLHSIPDAFLIIGRLVDSRVVKHMQNTQAAVNEYRNVRKNLSKIQVQFSLMFILVALLLLLAAVWYGMYFAARLVVPISYLVEAAERVRAGDYASRVNEGPEDDELATLGRAFNRMTNQLASQRRDLMKASRQIDNRRRFTEAVLAGVSAGVLALSQAGVITLFNRSAQQLLKLNEHDQLEGKKLAEILPEIVPFLQEVTAQQSHLLLKDITLNRRGKAMTLHVRVAVQEFDGEVEGFILTFDDISPLIAAQRHAAWADVARRVAHEIKNPLTPIQLSAQRLKKKYLPHMAEEEKESFEKYTETIIRHVGDIGKMVEEFVRFARMPSPVLAREHISDLVERAVFSEETAHPNVRYTVEMTDRFIFANVDASLIRQVITNLLKNAAEALETHNLDTSGKIAVFCKTDAGNCVIEIQDNGVGFPADGIHSMLEPYVTTRSKGTGLGLAIVKKIMEDHKGSVELENRPEGGALVRLVFALGL